MRTIQLELPDTLASLFQELCESQHMPANELMKGLIVDYLEELGDYQDALQALKEGGTPISLKEIVERHGLGD